MLEIIRTDGQRNAYLGEPLVVALGNFDGVHLGHRKIIDSAVSLAKKLNAECAVLAFDVHPQIYFGNGNVKLIMSEQNRFRILKNVGVRYVIRASFEKMKDMSPKDFLDVLEKDLHAVGAACGYNFSFGKGGIGKAEDIAKRFGANSTTEEHFLLLGDTVSSSRIRALTECGNVKEAALLLGRPFFVSGIVREGRRIGRTLDFPTANITIDENMLAPGEGIYATFTEINGDIYPSVTNYGSNPTVTDSKKMILETFVMNFSGDLYGENIRVFFIDKIRDQKKFPSLDHLRLQISEDKKRAESICLEYKAQGENINSDLL